LYQRVRGFQARHAAQLLPWERSWLALTVQELEYYRTKLSEAPDGWGAGAQPLSMAEVAQALAQLNAHTIWVAKQTAQIARRTLQMAQQTVQRTQTALQTIREAQGQAPACYGKGASTPARFETPSGGHNGASPPSSSQIPPRRRPATERRQRRRPHPPQSNPREDRLCSFSSNNQFPTP
jgi:hypothetical protein